MESVMPGLGGGLSDIIPKSTGPAAPVPSTPMPEGVGLGVPSL